MVLVALGLALVAAPGALANGSFLCHGYSGCAAAGYTDHGYGGNNSSYWRAFSGHNCTNYAAYVMSTVYGVATPNYLMGNGADWGRTAQAHGIRVDRTATVGSVAQWNAGNGAGASGHVAVVEQVGPGYIIVSEDNWSGNFEWQKLTPGGYYPTDFIHFTDATPPTKALPQPNAGPDAAFVKTVATGSGQVEVSTATAASGYQAGQPTATWISSAEAGDGPFQMVGPDLYFIKTKHTASGHVEIHTATSASRYTTGQHTVTWISSAEAANGWFQMVGADLYFIKMRHTASGHVEIHSATAASGFQRARHTVTAVTAVDAGNGWFQMVGPDLYFVKSVKTGSGHIEVFTTSAASGYQSTQHTATWISTAEAGNGWFQMVGTDLYFGKFKQTESGHVEIDTATSASGYQSAQHTTTSITNADAANGWFQVGTKG